MKTTSDMTCKTENLKLTFAKYTCQLKTTIKSSLEE